MELSCQSSYPLVGQRKMTVPSAQTGHTNDREDNPQQPLSSHLTRKKVNSDTRVCSQQLPLLFMLCKSLPFVSDVSAGSNNRNLSLLSSTHPRSSPTGRGLLAYCHKSLSVTATGTTGMYVQLNPIPPTDFYSNFHRLH